MLFLRSIQWPSKCFGIDIVCVEGNPSLVATTWDALGFALLTSWSAFIAFDVTLPNISPDTHPYATLRHPEAPRIVPTFLQVKHPPKDRARLALAGSFVSIRAAQARPANCYRVGQHLALMATHLAAFADSVSMCDVEEREVTLGKQSLRLPLWNHLSTSRVLGSS